MREWTYQTGKEDEGKTVEQLLRREGFSRKEISRQKFLPAGITLDGEKCRISRRVQAEQSLVLNLGEVQAEAAGGKAPDIRPVICYEDGDVLAAEKPSGLACHTGRGHYCDNFGRVIQEYLDKKGEYCAVREIGRLDRDTSGIMVFAKNQAAAARLWRQRDTGEMGKVYTALAHGWLLAESGRIDFPMEPVPQEKNKMRVCETGMEAVTNYRVLKRGIYEGEKVSLVECRPETGRTHQIRVHLKALGHPLLGDCLYGTGDGVERLCLHAGEVYFCQPFTGERIERKKEPRFPVELL